MYVKLLN